MAPHLFLSSGDPSGVAIGAGLMRTLKTHAPGITFAGLGGDEMVAEGMRLIMDPATKSAMWLMGNLKRVPLHAKMRRLSQEDWERSRPDALITIDYQAFHLFLGTSAQERGIPVIHFVGSQFWGRRYYTLGPIRRAYSHVLLIHEFEKPYYDEAGIDATYVGYPLFERLQHRELNAERLEYLRTLPTPRLALLPGSRHLEITASLPVMLEVAQRMQPRPYLLVSQGHPHKRSRVQRMLADSGMPGEVFDGAVGEILTEAELALITSGTATMEALYYGCPSVVIYRLHPFTYFIGKPHTPGFIAMPNLLAREEIVPEFLMGSRNPKRVAAAAQSLLDNADERDEQRRHFKEIKQRVLSGPVPSQAAAEVVLRIIGRAG